jgi:uncharacterized protein (DUF849 family)
MELTNNSNRKKSYQISKVIKERKSMKNKNKMFITAAITGAVHTPSMSQYLPITSQQIADQAVGACEAGAAVVHIHARNPENGEPSADVNLYREIVTSIKKRCNVIICITSGAKLGFTTEQRLLPVITLKPELASFNAGSMNFAIFRALEKYNKFRFDWEENYLQNSDNLIFPNTFKAMREFAVIFEKTQTVPEFEVYDSGMINNIKYLIDKGYVKKPVYIQFVMGILGGIPAESEALLYLMSRADKWIGNYVFSVAAAGRDQIAMCNQSLLLGGNVRVGLEDNLSLQKGVMAKNSAEQVAKIARIARELDIEPATPDEARQILGLKGLDKVNF